eukprot:TRINITY_DN11144_c0_g1_i1.p1 TRINITY_DN11144_c0_g1~~TRINITY_DN11144_c0_g1_i1.p1  ORF type:complete len:494 (+),score=229.25 TRINITY_DN11144_c0_g1_i1:45-1526(+)
MHSVRRSLLGRAAAVAGGSPAGALNQSARFAHSNVTDADLAAFRNIVGERGVLTEDIGKYTSDWLGKYSGESPCVVRPSTAEQVAEVLGYCNGRNIAVVPQAGNTGLVGGSVPTGGEIVVSVERLNKVLSVDPLSRAVDVEAGVVLQTLEDQLLEHDLTVPLDLAAKGSCMIGGNVATNAGGIRFLRYGSLHQNVLGMRVAMADGTLLDLRNKLPKDNTGYDLKHLFIGSEGTLGIITDLTLQAPSKLSSTNVALVGCDSFEGILATMQLARQHLGEMISALEFADARSVEMSLAHTQNAHPFGEDRPPFYLLIESLGSNADHDMEKFETFLETAMEEHVVTGTVAQDSSQSALLWAVRENITVSFKDFGSKNLKYDVSLPTADFYNCVSDTQAQLDGALGKGEADVVGFGHIGDGNLHLNVITSNPDVSPHMEPWLYEWLKQRNGSVSAEHGIGLMKRDALKYSKSESAIAAMRQIKQVFDPKNILNPFKVL